MAKAKGMANEVADQSMERELPSFNVSETDLPAIKKWEVGKTYIVEVKAEMVEIGKNQYGTDKDKMYARLKVKEFLEAAPDTGAEEKASKAYMAKEQEEEKEEK